METGEDNLASVVTCARDGDPDAFGVLVRRFQDMAVGYGYSILRDFQLAEDAVQEAFLDAYRNLSNLREPMAFPGWFRRIVFKHCDRIIRRPALASVPLETVNAQVSGVPSEVASMEQREIKDRLLEAVDRLPEHERAATMLYYLSGYSQKEVATFLDVPETTIKKRLHAARSQLRESLLTSVEESLRKRRPSRDERFATGVIEILKAARMGDTARVKMLLEQDLRLLKARDSFGNTALVAAAIFGHNEIVELLLDSGVRPDIYESAAMGKTERVAELLDENPRLLDSFSLEGFTPLMLAAHYDQIRTVELLLSQGADVNLTSKHPVEVTSLHAALFGAALFGRKKDTVKLLLKHGADVNTQRGGKGWPRSGWAALHYAVGFGFEDLVESILEHGADPAIRDDQGRTPLQVAFDEGHNRIIEILKQRGANL